MEYLKEYHIVHHTLGLVHTLIALAAMAIGAYVLVLPKGNRKHRMVGYAYTIAMLLVNATAFGIYTWGRPSLFHGFAAFSTVTVIIGVWKAYKKNGEHWLASHYYFMTWSVVGLYCAFWAEVGTRLFDMRYFWWAVMLATVATSAIGGYWIRRKSAGYLQMKNHSK